MIPLTMIPWRLIGLGAAVAAVGLMGWRVSEWRQAYKALPGVEAALEAEKACEDGSNCAERVAALQAAQEAVSQQVVSSYEQELAGLRDRPLRTRTVRVCPEAAAGDVRYPAAPDSTDGAGAPAGIVSGPPGRDIGPELYQLATDADQVAARLRALQEYNRALSSPPER